ncbi:TIGR02757 family protein [Phocaeicola sp.]|uniref:TIGR02757 family protein n=1 Tax=Phocaeicola sp. TaxID=2773926 RepID=UPI0023CC9173|nr:TIGR02757 family protein [Phocaeicola sp.]MDE5678196.1 TIGR02757 family protein [Phocaeicola sp.]
MSEERKQKQFMSYVIEQRTQEELAVADFLQQYAFRYHNSGFISSDPVQFPHRYHSKVDIEISAFLTAFLSFGARPQILKAAERLDAIMNRQPLQYVLSEKWKTDFYGEESFYRTISKNKMAQLFYWLYAIYNRYDSMEEALLGETDGIPMQRLCRLLGVSDKTPQKKLNMFLRWMIRRDSEVDFGIWENFSPCDLLIPLDTHVSEMAFRLGLTNTKSYTLNNAKAITRSLAKVFPEDPCMGDFALFGYGVNESKKEEGVS